jgi:hypothetical protein
MKSLFRIVTASLLAAGSAAPVMAQTREAAAMQRQAVQQRFQVIAALERQTQQQRAREAQQERARRLREAALTLREREVQKWPEATEAFSQTVRLGRNGTFELQNVAGDIVVTGGGGDDVRIEATKRARHPQDASARAALRTLEIQVVERGGNVQVRTEYSRGSRNTVARVDYRISVPSSANLVLGTMSGNVSVSNVAGELRARATSGNVITSSVRRVRQLATVSGNVEVADAETDELEASSVDGDIVLRNVKGRILELSTVTGDARLIDVELDRASLQSMAGDLEFNGRLARSGRYDFQTHSGTIRVVPSGAQGFDLEATSFSGDVRSDFALKTAGAASRGPQRMLRGTFGDAGAMVSAQSFAGDILIVRR